MNTPGLFDEHREQMRKSVAFRMVAVGVLVLVLLIPVAMVRGIIEERRQRSVEATMEITGTWGNAQIVEGPYLTIPYAVRIPTGDDSYETRIRYAHFLPESLDIGGTLVPEVRYRGIYEAVTYTADLRLHGTFARPDWSSEYFDTILWSDATLSVGISDMRGVRENVVVTWNGAPNTLKPGQGKTSLAQSNLGTQVPVADTGAGGYEFSIPLSLNGSEDLRVIPLGERTHVHLSSTWPTPSFSGAFLPRTRSINDTGFEADWHTLALNRSYPQQWFDHTYDTKESAFGVSLIQAVDLYHRTDRTAKYAVLFISLTFLTFFMIETLTPRRIHPIQYLLVGLALCLFYALLLSLSEHIAFGLAYTCATAGVVLMITSYSASVLRSRRLTLFMGTLLTVLYSCLYVLLNLEDYSLLMGSLGLFVALGVVMYVTRNVDWYDVGSAGAERGDDT